MLILAIRYILAQAVELLPKQAGLWLSAQNHAKSSQELQWFHIDIHVKSQVFLRFQSWDVAIALDSESCHIISKWPCFHAPSIFMTSRCESNCYASAPSADCWCPGVIPRVVRVWPCRAGRAAHPRCTTVMIFQLHTCAFRVEVFHTPGSQSCQSLSKSLILTFETQSQISDSQPCQNSTTAQPVDIYSWFTGWLHWPCLMVTLVQVLFFFPCFQLPWLLWTSGSCTWYWSTSTSHAHSVHGNGWCWARIWESASFELPGGLACNLPLYAPFLTKGVDCYLLLKLKHGHPDFQWQGRWIPRNAQNFGVRGFATNRVFLWHPRPIWWCGIFSSVSCWEFEGRSNLRGKPLS